MKNFAEAIITWICNILIGFDTKINGCVDILQEDIMSASNPMFQLAQNIAHLITPVALTIISICFLIEFLKISIKMDILKWEFALKVFTLLALSQAVISAAPFFLSAIYSTGADMVGMAMGNQPCTIGQNAANELTALTTDMKWGPMLGIAMTMLVPLLAIQACTIIIRVMAYARMFEIIVHVAISPIPCAFLPLEGSQMTKKFFLSFAAVSLQGLFMIICVRLFGVIITSSLAGTSGGTADDIVFNLLVGALVLVMSIIKTGQWSKSILDAN